MTATALTVNSFTESGLLLVVGASTTQLFEAAAASMSFANDGRTFLYVKNADATDQVTVTISYQHACSFGANHDRVVTLAAKTTNTSEKIIGPFGINHFNDATGLVHVAFTGSSIDAVTVCALRMGATVD